MYSDPIADLLTRIRNGLASGHPSVDVPASKAKRTILGVMVDEGFVGRVEDTEDENGKPGLKVYLKYQDDGRPVIRTIDRVSRPGRRLYVGKDDIPRHKSGLGAMVISTPEGMMSDQEARKRGIGGEIICSLF